MPAERLARLSPRLQTHLLRAQSHTAQAFDYALPATRIARHPLPNRSASKLLVASRGHPTQHHLFTDLPALLPPSALLVLNDSRVLPARVRMQKHATGGRAEILLLAPALPAADPAAAVAQSPAGQLWRAYVGGRRVRVGDVLCARVQGVEGFRLCAEVVERDGLAAMVRLGVDGVAGGQLSLAAVLDGVGETPLPPYIKRDVEEGDREAYQTVYAEEDGSVAAPTAGLHVTEGVLEAVRRRGVRVERVTLHVGAGTFAPVDAEVVGGHVMHEERVGLSRGSLRGLAGHVAEGRPVVALGTTSVRTLESIYWFGVRLLCDTHVGERESFQVEQWEPYERLDDMGEEGLPSAAEAISAVLKWSRESEAPIFGRTKLLIVPGYPFKMVDALITNFHQPRSTLLMLVSAFHGGEPEDLFEVYHEALDNDYRFLSYGDSSIYADPEFFSR